MRLTCNKDLNKGFGNADISKARERVHGLKAFERSETLRCFQTYLHSFMFIVATPISMTASRYFILSIRVGYLLFLIVTSLGYSVENRKRKLSRSIGKFIWKRKKEDESRLNGISKFNQLRKEASTKNVAYRMYILEGRKLNLCSLGPIESFVKKYIR